MPTTPVGRVHGNTFDQGPEGRARAFAAFARSRLDGGVQLVDRAEVMLDRAGMQRDHLGRLGRGGKLRLQPRALGAQRWQRGLGIRLGQKPLDETVARAGVLALDRRKARLQPRPLGARPHHQLAALGVIDIDEVLDRGLLAQLLAQRPHHGLLDRVHVVDAAVAAGGRLLVAGANDARAAAGAVDDRHAASAGRAAQQPGEQLARLALQVRLHHEPLALDRLCQHPGLIVDDAQPRRLRVQPLAGRVDPAHALAGVRVHDHADPVPDDAAGVKLVEDDPVPAFHVAVDGRLVPDRAAWRLDAFGIEAGHDIARLRAGDILGEDAPHDRRLIVNDR